ncbi:MAG: hypothetical protein V4857_23970 [Pseudomonadota bacterium]
MLSTRFSLCILMLFAMTSAGAANNRATDAAFGALLSMPGAKPAEGGSWDFPEPEDFDARSESALITYLARQQKRGADVNAYRHHGTLMHHAIRAGAEKTAIWLLKHGANPSLTLRGSSVDALALSLAHKQARLAKMLQDEYRLAPAAQPLAPAMVVEKKPSVTEAVSKHLKTPASLQQALAGFSRAELRQNAQAALEHIASSSAMQVDRTTGARKYTVPAESWRVFWRYFGNRFDYAQQTRLANSLAPELWSELIAGGYPADQVDDAIGCMLVEISAADLTDLWPQMIRHFPGIRQAAPRLVLSSFRMKGRNYCYHRNDESIPAKLLFLTSLGIREPVSGLAAAEINAASPALKAAVQAFIPAPKTAPARLVDAAPKCAFRLTDVWLSALTGKTDWPISTVQLLEMPGSTECALLVGGAETSGEHGNVVDSFYGPEYQSSPSCPDPKDAYQVWYRAGAKIAVLKTDFGYDDSASGPALVRDTKSGKRYYLNDGEQNGRCHGGQRLPFVFEWRPEGLMLAASNEIENALLEQCSQPDGGMQCPGIAELTAEKQVDVDNRTAFDGVDPGRFVLEYGAERRNAYLAAVMALDKAKLESIQALGIPGNWTGDAIAAVGASSLSLEEKRKRIAWLFYDHAQLERAFDHQWPQGLLGWLPYEDWRPITKVVSRGNSGYFADVLRAAAQGKGMEQLACDLDNARELLCGETISAGRE